MKRCFVNIRSQAYAAAPHRAVLALLDFRLAADFDWARTFHPRCLEICLNFSGRAEFELAGEKFALAENQLAWYLPGRQPLTATRRADSIHRFLTLEVSRDFLARQFAAAAANLQPEVRRFLETERPCDSHVCVAPLPSHLLLLRPLLFTPPVPAPAAPWWYQGKILEIITHTLFAAPPPAELFNQGPSHAKYAANPDKWLPLTRPSPCLWPCSSTL